MEIDIDLTQINKSEIIVFENEIELREYKEDKIINKLNIIYDYKDLIKLEENIIKNNQIHNPYYKKYEESILQYKEDQINQLYKEINELRRKNSELKGVIKQLSD